MTIAAVFADTEDQGIQRREFGLQFCKLDGLKRAPQRIAFRIEVKHQVAVAFEPFQIDELQVGARERELGGLTSGLQHVRLLQL